MRNDLVNTRISEGVIDKGFDQFRCDSAAFPLRSNREADFNLTKVIWWTKESSRAHQHRILLRVAPTQNHVPTIPADDLSASLTQSVPEEFLGGAIIFARWPIRLNSSIQP